MLRTRRALRRLGPGRTLAVACTDPLAVLDIPNLAREIGVALTGTSRDQDVVTFRLRRAG